MNAIAVMVGATWVTGAAVAVASEVRRLRRDRAHAQDMARARATAATLAHIYSLRVGEDFAMWADELADGVS